VLKWRGGAGCELLRSEENWTRPILITRSLPIRPPRDVAREEVVTRVRRIWLTITITTTIITTIIITTITITMRRLAQRAGLRQLCPPKFVDWYFTQDVSTISCYFF